MSLPKLQVLIWRSIYLFIGKLDSSIIIFFTNSTAQLLVYTLIIVHYSPMLGGLSFSKLHHRAFFITVLQIWFTLFAIHANQQAVYYAWADVPTPPLPMQICPVFSIFLLFQMRCMNQHSCLLVERALLTAEQHVWFLVNLCLGGPYS